MDASCGIEELRRHVRGRPDQSFPIRVRDAVGGTVTVMVTVAFAVRVSVRVKVGRWVSVRVKVGAYGADQSFPFQFKKCLQFTLVDSLTTTSIIWVKVKG